MPLGLKILFVIQAGLILAIPWVILVAHPMLPPWEIIEGALLWVAAPLILIGTWKRFAWAWVVFLVALAVPVFSGLYGLIIGFAVNALFSFLLGLAVTMFIVGYLFSEKPIEWYGLDSRWILL